ncbi:hypothetical protein BCV70DRAFT_205050 [Testicularia cyperi]|uniref:DUF221-domain-containing protein n=1 Tax=Testicularia cyperi TaxID=1882483 RepID=A0A317XVW0_9BASI|nr:hypothetical protein BCV70DRAFT_205050 [Testicularia cyperi]
MEVMSSRCSVGALSSSQIAKKDIAESIDWRSPSISGWQCGHPSLPNPHDAFLHRLPLPLPLPWFLFLTLLCSRGLLDICCCCCDDCYCCYSCCIPGLAQLSIVPIFSPTSHVPPYHIGQKFINTIQPAVPYFSSYSTTAAIIRYSFLSSPDLLRIESQSVITLTRLRTFDNLEYGKMGDLNNRNFNTSFQGLVTTCAIFAGVGGAAAIGYETLRQYRRLPDRRISRFWRKDPQQRHPPGGVHDNAAQTRSKDTCEDWEMGHLYHARVFHATTPSPPLPRWPFAWVKRAISFTDQFYADHTGMDTVVYVRFLRACLYWVCLHTLTTAPILLAIHIKFSYGVPATDMSRASLSYLVTQPAGNCTNADTSCPRVANPQGRSLLWIHLCLLWYLSITWILTLWWIGSGSLKIRRAQIEKTRERVIESKRSRATNADDAKKPNGHSSSSSLDAQQGLNAAPNGVDKLNAPPHQILSSAQGVSNDNSDGWRQRTLMVMNLPATMRDEASIRRYFEEFLRPDDDASSSIYSHDDVNDPNRVRSHNGDDNKGGRSSGNPAEAADAATHVRLSSSPSAADHSPEPSQAVQSPQRSHGRLSSDSDGPDGPQPDLHPDRHLKSPVQTVVLVRKMNELASMLARRQDILTQLEAAHIKLAQDVLVTVGRRTLKMRKRDRQQQLQSGGAEDGTSSALSPLNRVASMASALRRPFRRKKDKKAADVGAPAAEASGSSTPSEALDPDLEKLGPTRLTSAAKAKEEELARRLARFSPTNRGLHAKQAQVIGTIDSSAEHEMAETVWEALHQLPRDLLDPFQPATRLSALFRGQTVPTIDYLLTKLNLLTALVTEMRSRPPTSYEPTSTAFVTFRDPRQARMVWRELKDQIVVKVRLAPEVKDLDWDRLMKTSFTGDVVRGLGVSIGMWAFTIFWVIIINFITIAVFSVKSLKQLPGLSNFFDANPRIEGFVSITLPPIIVSLISMSIPELIFQVSKRAQGFVTFSSLYDMCLVRYWKFVICNVVIFFCVGQTAIETVLTKVGNSGRLLDTIASAFPTAAPFFVSYLILQLALQSGFEHVGFMIALLQHIGANKAVTPRTRAIKTLPRNFNRYYWMPLHLNVMAIVFIFALLNPLMLPFALVYWSVALVVFKKNFAYHYYRRFNEMEGAVYFVRMLRFSLDAIIVMQVVLLIFFSVIQEGPVYIGMTAVLIPITVIVKLLATRLWKSQCRAVDDEEAEALCGIDSRPLWEKMQRHDYGPSETDEGVDSRSPLDARASGRYPSVVPPPPTESAFHRAWQRVHDSFNANGLDKPSYLASAHAKGKRAAHPVEFGAKGIARTPRYVAKETAKHIFHYRSAAKATLGMDGTDARMRASTEQHSTTHEPVSGLPATSQLHQQHLRNSFSDLSRPNTTSATGDANVSADVAKANGLSIDTAAAQRLTHETSVDGLSRDAATSRRRKGDYGRSRMSNVTLRRGNSRRSEERPFLSGFEAVSAHAPVPSEDGFDLSFEDGDAPFLARHEGGWASPPRRHGRRGSAHNSTIKRKRSLLAVVTDEEHDQSSRPPAFAMEAQGAAGRSPVAADPLFVGSDEGKHANGASNTSLPKALSEATDRPMHRAEPYHVKNADYNYDEDEDDDDLEGRELVRPHPPVRWDDTPNNTARYNNPFYNQELDGFLWLPRNPLAPLDLCDTIEWYGPALVSSQGGRGVVGEWEDDHDSMDEDGEGCSHDYYEGDKAFATDDEIPFGGEAADMGRVRGEPLGGHEEIVLPDSLARHLEEVEVVDEAVDPAASVPRNLMQDYKRALRKSTAEGVSSDGDSASGLRRSSSSLYRKPSNLSSQSGQGGGGASHSPLLRIPSPGWLGRGGPSADMSDMASSPVSMRAPSHHMDFAGGSDPLSSVPEAGVMIPRRSTSYRQRTAESGATGSTNAEQPSADGLTPESVQRGQHQQSISFAPSYAGGDGTGEPPSPSRSRMASRHHQHERSASRPMRRDPSGAVSRASGFSTATNQRTVTLQAALRAEALEEERRITLRERLAASKRRAKRTGRDGSMAQDDAGLDVAGGEYDEEKGLDSASTAPRGTSTIMGRYEALHRRRETQASEFGARQDGAGGDRQHMRDLSSSSGLRPGRGESSMGAGGARLRTAALGVLSLTRASRVEKRNGGAQPSISPSTSTAMAMQEIKTSPAGKHPTQAADSPITGVSPSGVPQRGPISSSGSASQMGPRTVSSHSLSIPASSSQAQSVQQPGTDGASHLARDMSTSSAASFDDAPTPTQSTILNPARSRVDNHESAQ